MYVYHHLKQWMLSVATLLAHMELFAIPGQLQTNTNRLQTRQVGKQWYHMSAAPKTSKDRVV